MTDNHADDRADEYGDEYPDADQAPGASQTWPITPPAPPAGPAPGYAAAHTPTPTPPMYMAPMPTAPMQTAPMPTVPATATPAPGTRWPKAGFAAAVALMIAIVAGGVGGFVGYALHGDSSPLQTAVSAGSGTNAAPVVDRSSLASIAASVQPTVVVIETNSGEGSGVIISADGYIVTNNHVVANARGSAVQVTFNSGKQVSARIVGTDPKTDLAVVKTDATDLKFASWANSDSVQVGDTVLAIGSPLGLQGSVTAGIVSALHRTITVGGDTSPFDTNPGRTTIGDAIQTDAPINPGNSGGALVNTKGEVIGINSAIATSGSSGNIGVGFAISSNRAKAVADQLIKGGRVAHPFLGVSVTNAASGGAQVREVAANSPAAQAGLQVGDVITKIGDRAISGSEDLVGAVQSSTVGSQLTLTVERGGTQHSIAVTIGEAP